MRELNCQEVVRLGGAVVRTPTNTSGGKVFTKSSSGTGEIASNCGLGSVTRNCSVLYWDFSTEQHPELSGVEFCEPCLLWQLVSIKQARTLKPGTDSSWQCEVIGSQTKAANTKKMFLNDRTTIIDARKAAYVQSNLFHLDPVHPLGSKLSHYRRFRAIPEQLADLFRRRQIANRGLLPFGHIYSILLRHFPVSASVCGRRTRKVARRTERSV